MEKEILGKTMADLIIYFVYNIAEVDFVDDVNSEKDGTVSLTVCLGCSSSNWSSCSKFIK